MPDKTFLTDSAFITLYNTYSTYLTYLQQWATQVTSAGTALQNDPSYLVGLSAQEQSGVSSAVQAAQAFLQAVPVPPASDK